MAATDIVLDEKIKQKIEEPKKWKVILLNDDHTPMDFVIGVLTEIFRHTQETAKDITIKIHTEGSGIAGVYSYEIAEVKWRKNEFKRAHTRTAQNSRDTTFCQGIIFWQDRFKDLCYLSF